MLTIIQVGDNPASNTYIRNKRKAIQEANMQTVLIRLPESSTTEDVVNEVLEANQDSTAVMVQLPLPQHISDFAVLSAIDIDKDIDGLHPKGNYLPLTPSAIVRWLIEEKNIVFAGKNVVIIGRSDLVGKPLANIMIDLGATVSVCNSHSSEDAKSDLCAAADIVITATGTFSAFPAYKPKPGSIVIDVGINRDVDGKLCGDVPRSMRNSAAFKDVEITPVPGGVGKWTVRELVLRLREMENKISSEGKYLDTNVPLEGE